MEIFLLLCLASIVAFLVTRKSSGGFRGKIYRSKNPVIKNYSKRGRLKSARYMRRRKHQNQKSLSYLQRPLHGPEVHATAYSPDFIDASALSVVQIIIHKKTDQNEADILARHSDSSTEVFSTTKLGEIDKGDEVKISVSAVGAEAQVLETKKLWRGNLLQFGISVIPKDGVKNCVLDIGVWVSGALVGTFLLHKNIKESPEVLSETTSTQMTHTKSVFLSYSSQNREDVAIIAGAYQRACIPCFFDRASIPSGADWEKKLFTEIESATLFHLCWSQPAAKSKWVLKETRFALECHKKSIPASPSITIQMLDGPPWAPHPEDFNHLNFDDFLRAAVSGYGN